MARWAPPTRGRLPAVRRRGCARLAGASQRGEPAPRFRECVATRALAWVPGIGHGLHRVAVGTAPACLPAAGNAKPLPDYARGFARVNRGRYPFTAPAVRPARILRWKMSTSAISGSVTSTEAAMRFAYGSSNSERPENCEMATCTVRAL